MKGKVQYKFLFWSAVVLMIFVAYTLCVKFIGVENIGPNDSAVGFAKFNDIVHNFFGVHLELYSLTDWLSWPVIGVGMLFGLIGLIQWIKRKNLLKVDSNLWALGILYCVTFAIYVFFQFVVINKRPILLNGKLETSFPSSTMIISIIFTLPLIYQFKCYIKNKKLKLGLNILCVIYCSFLVVGRLMAGVHWATDIIGGLILSLALMLFYYGLIFWFKEIQTHLKDKEKNLN